MFRGLGVLSCVLLVTVTAAHGERLPIRTYTTEDGLAHARVRRIVRDPRGFLWFCTIEGLSRFDGAEFVTYRTVDGLPDHWVTDLLRTRDGSYWVATNGGVARFDVFAGRTQDAQRPANAEPPRQLFTVAPFEGSPTRQHVAVLFEDRAGRVWAGGQRGLSVLDRSGSTPAFRPVVPSPAAMVTSLVESVDGSLWIGTLAGLYHRLPSGDVLPERPRSAPAYATSGPWPGTTTVGSGLAMTRGCSCWGPERWHTPRHRPSAIRATAAPARHFAADFDFHRQVTTRAP
jgi:ligand-binding sensor domain-containing protein